MQLMVLLGRVLALAKPYRFRLVLGILCGFLAGLANPLLMVSVKAVLEFVFPSPDSPTLAQQLEKALSPTLSDTDVLDAPSLAAKLREHSDPLSRYLWDQLGSTNQAALAPIPAKQKRPVPLATSLAHSLNKVILGGPIHDPARFSQIKLRGRTRGMLTEPPAAEDSPRLNRLLLEDAYPRELRRMMPPWARGPATRLHAALSNFDARSSLTATVLIISSIPVSMFLRGLLSYLNIYLMSWVGVRATSDLRTRLFSHLLGLSMDFFHKTGTGELMSHASNISIMQAIITNSLVVIVKEPITVLSLALVLIYSQPRLTLVALLVLPLTLVPFVVYARKVRSSSAAINQQLSVLGKLMHESLTGFRILRAYNLEQVQIAEYRQCADASISHSMRILRSSEIPGPLIEFLGSVAVAAFFLYIARFSATKMTAGDLLQFVGCIFLMYQPIKALIRLHHQLEQVHAGSEAVFRILDTATSVPEPERPKALRAQNAEIRFDHISFSYGQKTILHDFNLTVRPGQLVALVGSSGAGKTTVTNLLLRFYDPVEGAVRIGDTDIREASLHDLRSQIAVVTQETILFNQSIARNIELGRPGASLDEVKQAARHAYAYDFIMEKERGFDTVIGERGVLLSGGQRQRLAIARAIVRNAPILILDEATNALDTESERAVQEALDALMNTRTTICIAHRLSTIQHADVIVVMDQGRIIETGTHSELLQRGGTYKRLYDLQFNET